MLYAHKDIDCTGFYALLETQNRTVVYQFDSLYCHMITTHVDLTPNSEPYGRSGVYIS